MLKDLFFFILRSALGFILITCMTMLVTSVGQISPEHFQSAEDPFFVYFFQGKLIVWFAAMILACLSFTGILKSFCPPALLKAIDWSPAYAPVVYGGAVYLWFILSGA
jgi:hypothetical protein